MMFWSNSFAIASGALRRFGSPLPRSDGFPLKFYTWHRRLLNHSAN